MVTHFDWCWPFVVTAVINESSSSRFSFNFLTRLSIARLEKPSESVPPCRWWIKLDTIDMQASAEVGVWLSGRPSNRPSRRPSRRPSIRPSSRPSSRPSIRRLSLVRLFNELLLTLDRLLDAIAIDCGATWLARWRLLISGRKWLLSLSEWCTVEESERERREI